MDNFAEKIIMVNDDSISNLFSKRRGTIVNHYINKVEAYSSKLHIHGGKDSNEIVSSINELFSHMSNKIKDVHRRKYCKILLNYCDLTQDWRYWGLWAEEEIRIGADSDSPWLFYGFGRYLEETGQLRQSFIYHKSGIEYSSIIGDNTFLALNHMGAGITLQRSEKHEKAEWHLKKALKLFSQLGNVYRVRASQLGLT